MVVEEGRRVKRARGTLALPEDLIAYEVLPRLPASELIRLQGVSRGWRRLISSDPDFARRQSAHARKSAALAVLAETGRPHFVWLMSPARRTPCCFRPPPVPRDLGGGFGCERVLLATCDGLSCFGFVSRDKIVARLVVGNPARNDWTPLLSLPPVTRVASLRKIGLAVYDTDSGATAYKLILPVAVSPATPTPDGKTRAFFHVLSSPQRGWEKFGKCVLLDAGPSALRFFRSVYARGLYFWHDRNEALWFYPKGDRAGALRLPSDVDARWVIGEWAGRPSFMKLVDRQIHLWCRHRFSWSFRILRTTETLTKAVAGLGGASLLAFGIGFILLCIAGQISIYDATTRRLCHSGREIRSHEHCTKPHVCLETLLKLS